VEYSFLTLVLEMVYDDRQCGAHNHFHGSVPDLDFNIYTTSHSTPVERTISFVSLIGLRVLLELIFDLFGQLEAFLIE